MPTASPAGTSQEWAPGPAAHPQTSCLALNTSGPSTCSPCLIPDNDASFLSFSFPLSLPLSSFFLRLPLCPLCPVPCPLTPALCPVMGGADPDTVGTCAHWGAGAEPAAGEGSGRAAAQGVSGQQGNEPTCPPTTARGPSTPPPASLSPQHTPPALSVCGHWPPVFVLLHPFWERSSDLGRH